MGLGLVLVLPCLRHNILLEEGVNRSNGAEVIAVIQHVLPTAAFVKALSWQISPFWNSALLIRRVV